MSTVPSTMATVSPGSPMTRLIRSISPSGCTRPSPSRKERTTSPGDDEVGGTIPGAAEHHHLAALGWAQPVVTFSTSTRSLTSSAGIIDPDGM